MYISREMAKEINRFATLDLIHCRKPENEKYRLAARIRKYIQERLKKEYAEKGGGCRNKKQFYRKD